jgi:hypothetical protein
MNTSRFSFFLLALALSAFFSSPALSFPSAHQPPGAGTQPAADLLRGLQERHQVHIFYHPGWLEEATLSRHLLELPFNEALQAIGQELNLTPLFVDDHILFVPSEGRDYRSGMAEPDMPVAGDPNQFGRFSRATLSGTIVCGKTGETLPGAVIFDPATGKGASSDMRGRFSIELPTGDLRLRLSYVGYEVLHQPLRLYSDGEIVFQMFESSVLLGEVTVSARRAEENISRTQMSMINIDSKAIAELPATFGERDIVRSITLLPGVQTVGEFGTGFHVRGGSADQNLILLEHVPLFNSSHLLGLISVVNPDLVSNVTLMKAGIPARFGERASSVMDVRLKNNLDQEHTAVMGGIGVLNSRAMLETPLIRDRVTLFLGGRATYSNVLMRNAPSEDLMNSRANFHDLTGTLNVAITPKNHLTLFGYHSFDRFGFGGETTHEYANTLGSMRLNSAISNRLSSTLVAGLSHYDYRITEESPVAPQLNYFMDSAVRYKTLKYFLSWYGGTRHAIEAGIQGVQYDVAPGNYGPLGEDSHALPQVIDSEKGLELSAFLSDDIALADHMSLEVGLRYTRYLQLGPGKAHQYADGMPRRVEHITDTLFYGQGEVMAWYHGLEPRIGFRYSFRENSSWKASYNRNFQYVNLISNTAIMAPADIWKLSDAHIRPLKSDQLALGYFRNFLENTLETSLEVYYKKMDHIIEYRSGAEVVMNEFLETDILDAGGYGYGAELYVKKNSGRLTGWTSYTYSVSRIRTDAVLPADQINRNNYFPSNYDRPHNLVVNAGYDLTRRIRVSATFSYSTGRPITLPEYTYWQGGDLVVFFSDRNKYRLPDYHRLDLSINLGENLRTRERGKGSLSLTLMNVYGRKNPYSVFYKRNHGSFDPLETFNLYQLYILGRPLPTVTYNFSF